MKSCWNIFFFFLSKIEPIEKLQVETTANNDIIEPIEVAEIDILQIEPIRSRRENDDNAAVASVGLLECQTGNHETLLGSF